MCDTDYRPIYQIALFETIRELVSDGPKPEALGVADTRNFDHVGFYYNRDDAVFAMHTNRCDIHENIFKYGFVLKHLPGLYNNSACKSERTFFKWDEERQGFYEAEEPELFEHLAL